MEGRVRDQRRDRRPKPDGSADDKVCNMTESARTLKFKTYSFEDL
jgi:hypothetical protein